MSKTNKTIKAQINEDLLLALIMLLCIIFMAVFSTREHRKNLRTIEKNKINIKIQNKIPAKNNQVSSNYLLRQHR